MDFTPRALERLQVKGQSGDWWQCLCISCEKPDTEGKLGINLIANRVSCFRCHLSTTAWKFLKDQLGYAPEEIKELLDPANLVRVKKTYKVRRLRSFPWEDVFDPVQDHSDAYLYLINRGISDRTIERQRIRYADPRPDSEYAWRKKLVDRVMIPVLEGDRVIYFVGRDMTGKQSPRYSNPPNLISPKTASQCLFNLELACEYEYVVLVEGVFDALRVGQAGVASFGKKLSYSQVACMVSRGVKEVCVLPDNEGLSVPELLRMIDRLWEQGLEVSLCVLPDKYKDAGEAPRQVIKEGLKARRPISRFEYFYIATQGRLPERTEE